MAKGQQRSVQYSAYSCQKEKKLQLKLFHNSTLVSNIKQAQLVLSNA